MRALSQLLLSSQYLKFNDPKISHSCISDTQVRSLNYLNLRRNKLIHLIFTIS